MLCVLIQDEKNKQKYNFLKIRKEDTKIKIEKVKDPDTYKMKSVSTEIGLGVYSSVIYEESDSVEHEKNCVEFLKTYNLSQLKFVDVKEYGIDFLWDLDNVN